MAESVLVPNFISFNAAERNGTHAVFVQENYASPTLALWSTVDVLSRVPLADWTPVPYYIPRSWAVEFLGTDKFVIAGLTTGGSGPLRVSVYSMTGQKLAEQSVGDEGSRWPASCRLSDGSVMVFSYRHVDDTGTQIFDVTKISPDGILATRRFEQGPAYASIGSQQWTIAQAGPGGNVFGFYSRDSSHRIGKAVVSPNLELLEFDPDYLSGVTENGIPRDGVASPNGEMPNPHCQWDSASGRIILGYQNHPGHFDCFERGGTIFCKLVLVAIRPSDSVWSVIGETDTSYERVCWVSTIVPNRVIGWSQYLPVTCDQAGQGWLSTFGAVMGGESVRGWQWAFASDGWALIQEDYGSVPIVRRFGVPRRKIKPRKSHAPIDQT